MECTIQKLPHLLQTEVLYNNNPNETNNNFTHWDDPLANAINKKIITNFLKTTFNTDTLLSREFVEKYRIVPIVRIVLGIVLVV